ncbi:uncharacterized protein LOC112467803 [Temnothorax curvispinosus]|uniref:Uncharacterized protein LOC112467803 n=1 Tax=Temnothorax curvispinosus TaxID=300111 RepID=A0A6J1RI75_9HYME|nr:uncharacterized protein LOC112467803 [Temnothorax curvispinosus]
MSEDYQHACQRAELLGLPRPSEEEWRQSQAAQIENRRCDDDDDDAVDAVVEDLDHADETAGRITGGLDELTTILSHTQKKLNRFKTVCGRMGTLLKVKVTSRGGTPRHKPEEPNPDAEKLKSQEKPESDEVMTVESSDDAVVNPANSDDQEQIDINKKRASNLAKVEALIVKAENAQHTMQNSGVHPKQIDLSKKMGSHLDKLDSMITKAENAQYSMQHQTKQMKKFLKK